MSRKLNMLQQKYRARNQKVLLCRKGVTAPCRVERCTPKAERTFLFRSYTRIAYMSQVVSYVL